MSETPRQTALLAELFAPDADVRTDAVLAHIADPVAAASAGLGPFVRARLADPDPALRLTAADYLWRVSGDPDPAISELGDRFRRGDEAETGDAMPLLSRLGRHAADPLIELARGVPAFFNDQSDAFVMWAARTVLALGPQGAYGFGAMVAECRTDVVAVMFTEFAAQVPKLDYDPGEYAGGVTAYVELPECVHAAGAAMWRLGWRVNRPWLDAVAAAPHAIEDKPDQLALLTRVLSEHLGRRPDLAPVVRAYLVRLVARWQSAGLAEARRLSVLGGCGWGVLQLVLQESPPADPVPVPDVLRALALREALHSPGRLALVHHHAHRFILDRIQKHDSRDDDLITAAAEVLTALGPAAGTALADVLKLLAAEPGLGPQLAATAKAVAPGHPLAASAVVRALGAVRQQGNDGRAVFGHLAGVLCHLDADAGPGLVSQMGVEDHVVAQVLDTGHWRDVPAAVRAKHAASLADLLGSPRADVRRRAADALKHYLPELPAVWPAVVAAFAGDDEKPVEKLQTYVRLLAPVADAAAVELNALFDDTNADYAARAGVALWRLGRWGEIAPRLRESVVAWRVGQSDPPPAGRPWEVLRGMWRRAGRAHGLIEDMVDLFADAPEPLASEVRTFRELPASLLDAKLSTLLATELPAVPLNGIQWGAVRSAVDTEPKPLPPLFALAVMCGYGTGDFGQQKIWMIKHHRQMAGCGLAEAKYAVERVMAHLEPPDRSAHAAAAVREFFPAAVEVPEEIRTMIDHPNAWYRWAGLELADAWGLRPDQVAAWVGDRRRDLAPFVRERALRIAQ